MINWARKHFFFSNLLSTLILYFYRLDTTDYLSRPQHVNAEKNIVMSFLFYFILFCFVAGTIKKKHDAYYLI